MLNSAAFGHRAGAGVNCVAHILSGREDTAQNNARNRSVWIVNYKKAVAEGWAPAPTNDVQKAIWDRMKAEKERGPANAVKITPPNQKK